VIGCVVVMTTALVITYVTPSSAASGSTSGEVRAGPQA
jgi:hypothetical protein